jgi:hypothetical protein
LQSPDPDDAYRLGGSKDVLLGKNYDLTPAQANAVLQFMEHKLANKDFRHWNGDPRKGEIYSCASSVSDILTTPIPLDEWDEHGKQKTFVIDPTLKRTVWPNDLYNNINAQAQKGKKLPPGSSYLLLLPTQR